MPSMSVRRIGLCSLRSSTSVRALKSTISAASVTGHPVVSKLSIGRIAERPSMIASSIASGSRPAPLTPPTPVMTILARVIGPPRLRSSSDELRAAQHDAAVRAAEAERIGQRHPHALATWRVEHEIEIAVRIGHTVIRVHRHLAAIDRERAHGDFDGTGGRDKTNHPPPTPPPPP